MERKKTFNIRQIIAIIVFFAVMIIYACFSSLNYNNNSVINSNITKNEIDTHYDLENIPDYTDNIYVMINNNVPYFGESDYTTEVFEIYSQFDENGRCGTAYANICKELMPEEGKEREKLYYNPTGWNQSKYNGNYVYHRCHLIARSLAGEENNKLNLITGTDYFNVNGMKPFENRVSKYIKTHPDNHVLYRVTPIYKGDNAVASGVEIEAYSVEDNGIGVQFNVFVYNIQPGVEIDYLTGEIINGEH